MHLRPRYDHGPPFRQMPVDFHHSSLSATCQPFQPLRFDSDTLNFPRYSHASHAEFSLCILHSTETIVSFHTTPSPRHSRRPRGGECLCPLERIYVFSALAIRNTHYGITCRLRCILCVSTLVTPLKGPRIPWRADIHEITLVSLLTHPSSAQRDIVARLDWHNTTAWP